MEVGQEREVQAAQFGGKGLVAVDTVDADAQNLGVELLEAGEVRLQRPELAASGAGEVEHIEGQHHHLAVQVGQAERAAAGMGRQGKRRRRLANVDGHS